MEHTSNILTDKFNRKHTYLRISLTEKCNLRCTYCMPASGIPLSPSSHLMTATEIFEIAKLFVNHGVTKIRLTGGEPLVRKDFECIVKKLAQLDVEIAITTNGILLERYLPLLVQLNITNITISIDSLQPKKNELITRRNYFEVVWKAIKALRSYTSEVKLNVVLLKGVNDNEIIDFIKLTKNNAYKIRFIEFMPFDGNAWKTDKLVSQAFILKEIKKIFGKENLIRKLDKPNDTARNYAIKSFKGSFAIISSITNPFCDNCNRIRLTADGKLKNCLFSANETSLLQDYRNGKDIISKIKLAVATKQKYRSGMDTLDKISDITLHSKNRSMIAIGG